MYQFKDIIRGLISWFGWVAYIIWISCYVLLTIIVGIVILIMPVIAYISFAFASSIARLALGGMGFNDTRPSYHSQFELTPSDNIGYSLATAFVSVVRFIFNLIFVLPFKYLIGRYTGMPLETSIVELPGYIIQSISYLRPPHAFSFYCGIVSFPLMVGLYFYLTKI
ncbi:hypothetical protein NIES22_51500 [Calothrix brevissima NIES-22]|nr:hypothetical protein NIES22_51500 [Calothrix brevissima NIES-22]